jgi:surface antigen
MRLLQIIALILSLCFVSACNKDNKITRLLSSTTGGLIGSQHFHLEERSKRAMLQSWYKALEFNPSGHKAEWRNRETGDYGSITPIETFKYKGLFCRKFEQITVAGGQELKYIGSACRHNSEWKMVKDTK